MLVHIPPCVAQENSLFVAYAGCPGPHPQGCPAQTLCHGDTLFIAHATEKQRQNRNNNFYLQILLLFVLLDPLLK